MSIQNSCLLLTLCFSSMMILAQVRQRHCDADRVQEEHELHGARRQASVCVVVCRLSCVSWSSVAVVSNVFSKYPPLPLNLSSFTFTLSLNSPTVSRVSWVLI